MTHIELEPQDFLALFFPLPAHVAPESKPRWDRNVFQGIANVKYPTQTMFCEQFLAAVHDNALAPNFRLAKWDVEPPNEDTDVERIDAAFFRSESAPTNWEDQIVPVSFKPLDSGLDPCDDLPPRTSDWDYLTRMEARKQLFQHAEDVSQYQHRTALYMLLIAERQFRFLRWDASGMIITQAADYVEGPCLLCEMLWRMSLLSDEQLGMDPTATRILPGTDDFKMMDAKAIPQASDVDHTERDVGEDEVIPSDFVFQYVREGFAKSLGAEWPRYRLEVQHEGSVRMFLVGKPAFGASGMTGRGTRGYVALDCKTGRFVWLKDTWRTYLDLLDQEGAVLAHLNSKGVPYVPTLICHGDVLDQVTRKPDLWEEDRSQAPSVVSTTMAPSPTPPNPMDSSSSGEVINPPQLTLSNVLKRKRTSSDIAPVTYHQDRPREDHSLGGHKHYRIVVQEVCMPLEKFESGLQLLELIYTCVLAHQAATNDANTVHCDISTGNILILPLRMLVPDTDRTVIKWWGYLSDWELARPVGVKLLRDGAMSNDHMGTWQYQSLAMLNQPTKVVETSDELESFFHVILYASVRYLVSNCTDARAFIRYFFDAHSKVSNRYICGTTKCINMRQGELLSANHDDLIFGTPLDAFFSRLLRRFKAHYAVASYDRAQLKAKEAPPTPRPTAALPRTQASFLTWLGEDSESDEEPEEHEELPGPKNERLAPDSAQRALAEQVQHHRCMLRALGAALRLGWPHGDRVVGDNVEFCKREPLPLAVVDSAQSARTNKRCRTDKTPISAPVLSIHSASLPGP